MFWTFLCPVRKVYTDSMFNIPKTFKKKTNIIERKKEANTLKAVWIFYCLKANRCGLTNILNLYLLNSCCYMLYSCPCRYYIEKKIWVWLEIKIRDRSRSVPLYLEQVSGWIPSQMSNKLYFLTLQKILKSDFTFSHQIYNMKVF